MQNFVRAHIELLVARQVNSFLFDNVRRPTASFCHRGCRRRYRWHINWRGNSRAGHFGNNLVLADLRSCPNDKSNYQQVDNRGDHARGGIMLLLHWIANLYWPRSKCEWRKPAGEERVLEIA